MALGRSHRVLAVTLALVTLSVASFDRDNGAVHARTPSGPPPTATPAPIPSAAPQPVVALPVMPSDADLATAASTGVADTPPVPSGDVDVLAVAAAAAAQVGTMTTAEWSLDALADSFQGDPARAFAFVRDSIGFDAYPGVLRGAAGTLAARAGNATDRALLLKTLLDAMALQTRFAFGTLDGALAQAVAERTMVPPARPLQNGRAAGIGPLDVDAIGARARRDDALLRLTLGARLDTMSGATAADLAPEVRDHVWVQVAWGTDWLDYDPTLPDSTPGHPLVTPTSTSDTLSDDSRQSLRVEVIAGSLASGSITDGVVLDQVFDAASISDAQVFLYFQPQADDLGGTITNTLSGVQTWTPVLMVDGEATSGGAFAAGGRGTDLFGDAVDTPPLATLRMVVTRSVPGRADESGTHVLLDRVPDRLVDSDSIEADDLAPLAGDQTGPLALGVMEQILVSTGSASPWLQAVRRGVAADYIAALMATPDSLDEHKLGDLLYPLAVANASLVMASEQLAIPAATVPGRTRAYVDSPRVMLVDIGQSPTDASDFQFATDLLLDEVRVVAANADATREAALGAIWYGALESAIETESSLRRAAGLSDEPISLAGTSLDMSQPLQLLDGEDVPATGARALRDSLDAGSLAVVVGAPATSRTWWAIDPTTGTTRAILDPGTGGIAGGVAWGAIKHLPPPPRIGGGGGANVWHVNPDGSITRVPRGGGGGPPMGPPPSRCGGGQEYVTILGCVSIPAAWAIRIGVGLVVFAVVVDAAIYLFT